MPSHEPLPGIQDHLRAYGAEINALRRPNADTRSGSGYDIFGGTSAVLFAREATHERDLFRAIYFDSCSGDDVDVLIQDRYSIARIEATQGSGTGVFERPAAGAGGTFLRGTRIAVTTPGSEMRVVEVAADTPYVSTDVACVVPVRNTTAGASRRLGVNRITAVMQFIDPIDDSSWSPSSLEIGPGTDREKDADYKGRTKTTRLSNRVGYAKSITDACMRVGAGQVVLFASDQLNDGDFGINRCFVGSISYESNPQLLRDCRIAVDSARVLGADLTVMGMASELLTIYATVTLWTQTSARNILALQGAAQAAIVEYFNTRANAYSWRTSAIQGAVLRGMRTDVRSVDIAVNSLQFPDTETQLTAVTYTSLISRFYTVPSEVHVTVVGPS